MATSTITNDPHTIEPVHVKHFRNTSKLTLSGWGKKPGLKPHNAQSLASRKLKHRLLRILHGRHREHEHHIYDRFKMPQDLSWIAKTKLFVSHRMQWLRFFCTQDSRSTATGSGSIRASPEIDVTEDHKRMATYIPYWLVSSLRTKTRAFLRAQRLAQSSKQDCITSTETAMHKTDLSKFSAQADMNEAWWSSKGPASGDRLQTQIPSQNTESTAVGRARPSNTYAGARSSRVRSFGSTKTPVMLTNSVEQQCFGAAVVPSSSTLIELKHGKVESDVDVPRSNISDDISDNIPEVDRNPSATALTASSSPFEIRQERNQREKHVDANALYGNDWLMQLEKLSPTSRSTKSQLLKSYLALLRVAFNSLAKTGGLGTAELEELSLLSEKMIELGVADTQILQRPSDSTQVSLELQLDMVEQTPMSELEIGPPSESRGSHEYMQVIQSRLQRGFRRIIRLMRVSLRKSQGASGVR